MPDIDSVMVIPASLAALVCAGFIADRLRDLLIFTRRRRGGDGSDLGARRAHVTAHAMAQALRAKKSREAMESQGRGRVS